MNNFLRHSTLALSLAGALALTGCDVTMQPAQLRTRAERNFDLADSQGGRFEFAAGAESEWVVRTNADKREIEIIDANTRQTAVLKGVKFDRKDQTLTVSPRSSGQKTLTGERVGLQAQRTLRGGADVQKEVFKGQPCVIRQCRIGTTNCWDYYYGYWDVQRTTTTWRYDVVLDLTSEDGALLARARGVQSDVKLEQANLTHCQ